MPVKKHNRGGTDGVLRSLLFVLTWLSACLCLLTLFANCFMQGQSVFSVLTAVGFFSKSGCFSNLNAMHSESE